MGYRKFSEEREAKRGHVGDLTREQEVKLEHNEITAKIKAGEPLFSVVMTQYGYNAVVRATEPPPGRRQRKRRSYGQEQYND